jgi:DNA-binding phage protein
MKYKTINPIPNDSISQARIAANDSDSIMYDHKYIRKLLREVLKEYDKLREDFINEAMERR